MSTEQKQWTWTLPDCFVFKMYYWQNFLVYQDSNNHKFSLCESGFLPRNLCMTSYTSSLAFPACLIFLGILSLLIRVLFAPHSLKPESCFLDVKQNNFQSPQTHFSPYCVLWSTVCQLKSKATMNSFKCGYHKTLNGSKTLHSYTVSADLTVSHFINDL